MGRYETLERERDEQVATIELLPSEEWDGHDLHWELSQLLSELRGNLGVRVVVITGKYDDFYISPPAENFGTPGDTTLDASYRTLPSGPTAVAAATESSASVSTPRNSVR